MAEVNIDRLTLEILLKESNVAKEIDNITKALKNLKKASGDIDKVADKLNNISPTSARRGKTSKGGSKNKKSDLNIFGTLGKWNYLINITRYYGRGLANIVQLSMNYVETQNLWQVANRNNIAQASEFIDKMNKAYGISEQTLMNYQALFKTMLSSLGDLSDMMSTTLSQQITQMALDFSSLYNVSIADAMTKFQAVLSGQVRPIRSVSGYDITENTIYDIYSKMGGEKTMRQLSQLEKRLLRIYAVFDQMGESGATGDLARTINSASNQARIMNEQFKEAMTWTGQIILSWLNSVGVFTYINAILITITQSMKAIAYSSNAVPEDFFEGAFENIDDANKAMDELQGKLLSFDKFQALNNSENSSLGIDPIIEQLISKIDVGLSNVNMDSQKIADSWLNAIGLGEEMYRVTLKNGDVVTYTREEYEKLDEATKSTFTNVENYRAMSEQFQNIADALKSIGIVLGTLVGYKLIKTIGSFTGKITNLTNSTKLFQATLASGVIYSIIKAVEAFKDGDIAGGILATTIGVTLVGAMVLMELRKNALARATQYETMAQKAQNESLKEYNTLMANANTKIARTRGAFAGLATAVASVALSVTSIVSNWDKMSSKQKGWVIAIASITAAVAALAFAVYAATQQWGKAISVAAGVITAGATVSAAIPMFKEGGFPEDGLFFANSGEMVGKFSNGKTAVANNDQITTGIAMAVEPAVYRAVKSAMATGSGGDIVLQLDGRELARANVGNNARALSSSYRIDLKPR